MTRPIPETDPHEYAAGGAVISKPNAKHNAVSMELHHCTAFFDRNEALQVVISLAHAGAQQWGHPFIADCQRLMEAIYGPHKL